MTYALQQTYTQLREKMTHTHLGIMHMQLAITMHS